MNKPTNAKKGLKIGMIFPGQGAQFLGMGKELYDQERIIQEYFEDASNCLGQNFVKLCFASSEEMLKGTIETQTAIFLVSAAIYELLKQKHGITPDLVAGHSLGEYTAVFAAKGMNFPDALYLLKKRASFMKQAIDEQNGGLLAVLGSFSLKKLEAICQQYNEPGSFEKVAEISCFNSPTQRVVAGTMPELESIKRDVEMLGGKTIMVPVAGAFHSRMMLNAEKTYSQYLIKADFNSLQIPLVSNVMGEKITSPEATKLSLVKQTSSKVYWWKSIEHFKDMDLIVEVGPNNKLTKMILREWPNQEIIAINSPQDIENLHTKIPELAEKKLSLQNSQ